VCRSKDQRAVTAAGTTFHPRSLTVTAPLAALAG
jgi:hypothetical protein